MQREINQSSIEIIPADLSTLDNTNKLITSVRRKNTKIHTIIHVAGIWHQDDEVLAGKNYQNFSHNQITSTMNVGLVSFMLLVNGLLDLMPEKSNILAISGTFTSGAKGWLPYYTSKRGLEDFMIGLAQELSSKNIFVNCISPSDTLTPQYKKYFPQYASESQSPQSIATFVTALIAKQNTTGQVYVLEKDKAPYLDFHH